MRSRFASVCLCPLMCLISSMGAAGERAMETVVYTALRPANWDIYLFDSTEKPPRRLTGHAAPDYNAAVSPDGRWVVFCSERRGNPDLFIIDLDKPAPPRLLLECAAMEDAPAFSPDGRRLAFVSTRDGNAEVYIVPFDGEKTLRYDDAVNVTNHPRGDFNPAFSPDGKRLAFSSDRDGYKASEIYVAKADGSGVKRLTKSAGWDGSPAWSAAGRTIYFYSERDGEPRIYRMNADGTGPRAISPPDEPAVSPAITAEGRIVYAVQENGRWRIASVDAKGRKPRKESDTARDYWSPCVHPRNGKLVCHGTGPEVGKTFESGTPGPFLLPGRDVVRLDDRTLRMAAVRGYFPALNDVAGEVASDEGFSRIVIASLDGAKWRQAFKPKQGKVWRPAWSKDGRWLACTAGPTFGKPDARADIWKFRPDGSGKVNLTPDSAANDAFPDFSPDGRWITFRSGRDGNHEIYLIDADGKDPRRLTDHEATDTMPAFSPDGRSIAFTSQRDGDYEIYLLGVTPEGRAGKLRRLTNSPGRDTHPKFSPDGKWLVFASERGGMNDESPLIPVFNPQPYGEIFAMALATGKTIRLTHNKWEDGTPAWGK